MNISLSEPCRWLPNGTIAENSIREIFFHHWEKLRNCLLESINQVNEWRHKFIEDVNKCANEQIRILAEDYERQRLNLDAKCEENLETTRAYRDVPNEELFKELYNGCQSLEFQVTQLELISGTMHYFRVITISEQMEKKRMEKFAMLKTKNEDFQENRTIERVNDMKENRDTSEDPRAMPVSSVSNQVV